MAAVARAATRWRWARMAATGRPEAPGPATARQPLRQVATGRVLNRSEAVTASTMGFWFSASSRVPTKAGSSDQPDGAMTATMRGEVSLGFSK